jgi:hypothetical protein
MALISLGMIIALLFSGLHIDLIAAVTLIISTFIVLTTLFINSKLLLNWKSLNMKYVIFNLIICIIQSVSFFSDGFCYKYTQGLEWVGFLHYDPNNGQWDSGAFFSKTMFEFIFNFKSANGIMIGTNFITLLLGFYYYYLFKILRKESVPGD